MATALVLTGALLTLLALSALALWWRRRRHASPADRTFSGTFTYGWEVSSFVPDSNTTEKYWVAWTPESRFMEQLKAAGYDAAWTPGYAKARVRFIGQLQTGGGGYGHMGQYDAQVTVLEVLEMSRVEQKEAR